MIPALDEADGPAPENPFAESELVIYTTEVDDHTDDPETEWGEYLGLLSYSLWARYEDEGVEIPLYQRSETGAWISMSVESFHPDPADPVSDAFVEAIVNMVDEDVGDGWGDPTEDTFEEMRDVEMQLFGTVQWAFLKMESDEAALVIDWCEKRHAEADPDA